MATVCEFCGRELRRPQSPEEYESLIRHRTDLLVHYAGYLMVDRTGEAMDNGRSAIASIMERMELMLHAQQWAKAHPVHFIYERNEYLFGMLD